MERRNAALFVATIILAGGCKDKKPPEKDRPLDKVMEVHKPPSSFGDTLMVPKNAVVFFQPDSLQLLKIKAVTSEPVFRSTMHEYEYQIGNARAFLKRHWPQLKVIDSKRAGYLLFRKKEGDELINLDLQDPSGMFVWDGHNKPLLVDMMNVETQVSQYFGSSGEGNADSRHKH